MIAVSMLLGIGSGISSAELPAFNPDIPTSFTGKPQSYQYPGGAFNIYLTGPENATASIIMIHEWWGLNPHIKGLADQLGKLGWRVYAVDLYDGKTTDNADTASAWMKLVDPEKTLAKLKAAIADASTKHGRVGTIGWCFGGGWSLKASLAEPDKVNATIIYYGMLVTDPVQLKKLTGPVLGIFGTQDKWITPASVADFQRGLNAAGKVSVIKSYDADHAFANPSGVKFNLEPAKDAWKNTMDFLNANLSPTGKPAGKKK
jgi:carboxymethylenebutenolidase